MSKRGAEDAIEGLRQKMVNRINKHENRLAVSMYVPQEQERAEGEEWIDDKGQYWIMKDGKKEQVFPYAGTKTPYWCPKCSKTMSHHLDEKFYRKKGMCFNCVVRMETQIRIAGEWDKYEKWVINNNEISFLKEAIIELEDYKNSFVNKTSFVLSSGELQKWDIQRVSEIQEKIEEKIEEVRNRLEEINKTYEEFDLSKYMEQENVDENKK